MQLLKNMMAEREKPVHLVIDGLPAYKKALVKEYVASTAGALTLHFLPGYAPDLNPDELVWSHAKRTGVARSPLRKGEKLKERVDAQLQSVAEDPALVRSNSTKACPVAGLARATRVRSLLIMKLHNLSGFTIE